MKKWEFLCPKSAFIELIEEFQRKTPNELHLPKAEIQSFVEKFLKRHFIDYFP